MTVRVMLAVSLVLGLLGIGMGSEQTGERQLRPRRLYFGAPPATPHTTAAPMDNCLGCHNQESGFAPQTPHPTQVRCTQCHVDGGNEAEPFRSNGLEGLAPPELELDTPTAAPPPMRHSALLRENCLACHAPGAREAIVATPHPERAMCQLCHRPQVAGP